MREAYRRIVETIEPVEGDLDRLGLLATPSLSALFFLYAAFLVLTVARAHSAAEAGLPLAGFFGLFRVLCIADVLHPVHGPIAEGASV